MESSFEDRQTLNRFTPATETGEIGGLVNSDRPVFADTGIAGSTVEPDDDAPSSGSADDKPADDNAAEATPAGEDKPGEADQGGTEEEKDTRLDRNPRFKQILAERDKERIARERLEAQMEILTKPVAPPPPPVKDEAPAFKDTSKMSEEELAEWQANDPKSYEANLAARIKYELLRDLNQHAEKHSQEAAVEKTYAAFGSANPDFEAKWKTGEVKKYIDTHPGHNPMSAYHELTIQERIDAAVAKAKADTEKEVVARINAKQKATVLGSGPAAAKVPLPSEADDKIKFKEQGGTRMGLANLS